MNQKENYEDCLAHTYLTILNLHGSQSRSYNIHVSTRT